MADDKTFTKDELDAAIEKAIGPLKESVGNLETKRDELIAENRKLKRGAEIKPEDLTAAEERADKAETALAAAQKDLKTATAAAEKATKALETEQGYTQKLLIQDGLKSALIANGVKDEDYIDMAVAKFAGSASVKVDGDTRTAMIGDKPLADAIKEWAGTDAGKKVVAAPANSGGGSAGGKGSTGSGKTMTQDALNALKPAERAGFFADGGRVVDQAA